jgi:hypothetical protein
MHDSVVYPKTHCKHVIVLIVFDLLGKFGNEVGEEVGEVVVNEAINPKSRTRCNTSIILIK